MSTLVSKIIRSSNKLLFVPLCAMGALLPSVLVASDTVVANINAVPYQRVSATFNLGVVAFHENGADVEFEVRRGATVLQAGVATQPTFNPQSGTWEYWLALNPAAASDGLVEVHVTATPDGAGSARVLAPFPLYYNADGTLSSSTLIWADSANGSDSAAGTQSAPVASLAKAVALAGDGGTVYLKAGTYSANNLNQYTGTTRNQWTTITAAPGVARDDVEIGSGRPHVDKLHFRNVTLFVEPNSVDEFRAILGGSSTTNYVWVDECKMYSKTGRLFGDSQPFNQFSRAYVTGGLSTELNNGPSGFVRDHHIYLIRSDALSAVHTAINCVVERIDRGGTSAHPDFIQTYKPNGVRSNIILYNVLGIECESQGFYGSDGSTLQDSAFVNVVFDRASGNSFTSQYANILLDHVLFFHITHPNTTWRWRSGLETVNTHVRNSIFASYNLYDDSSSNPPPDISGLTSSYNHVSSTDVPGTNTTMGDPLFVDAAANDFHLAAGSPAAGNGVFLECVPADIEGTPHSSTARNRGAYADATTSIDPALLLWHRYDESSGTVASDSSGQGNVGALVNGASWSGGTVQLDGTDDHLTLPAGFANFSNGLTISIRANPSAVRTWARFVDFGNGSNSNNIGFGRRNTTNDLRFQIHLGSQFAGSVDASGAITNNAWHRYTVTMSPSGAVKLYKDGVVVGTGTLPLPNNVNRTKNYVGKSNWSVDQTFAGGLDDLRIYERELTATEVAALP